MRTQEEKEGGKGGGGEEKSFPNLYNYKLTSYTERMVPARLQAADAWHLKVEKEREGREGKKGKGGELYSPFLLSFLRPPRKPTPSKWPAHAPKLRLVRRKEEKGGDGRKGGKKEEGGKEEERKRKGKDLPSPWAQL